MKLYFKLLAFFMLCPFIMQAQATKPCNIGSSASGLQIYNMSFDHWVKEGKKWCPYSGNAPEKCRVWDTANQGLSILGINGTEPEDEIVAVKGKGKRAAKLRSTKVLWAFAAGAIYTGRFVRIVNWSGAEITWGIPFTARPKSLSGYYYYLPKPINYTKKPYKHLKGTLDKGQIEVILTDWKEPFHIITNSNTFVDVQNDKHIIGHGELSIENGTSGYVEFKININYRSDRTPTLLVILATPSKYGAYFTGGAGSTLYLDEFRFNY